MCQKLKESSDARTLRTSLYKSNTVFAALGLPLCSVATNLYMPRKDDKLVLKGYRPDHKHAEDHGRMLFQRNVNLCYPCRLGFASIFGLLQGTR